MRRYFIGKKVQLTPTQEKNLNTISSTEAELVGTSNILPTIVWVIIFLDTQDLDIKLSTLNKDNINAI